MADESQFDQLDRLIDAELRGAVDVSPTDGDIVELLSIARDLTALPTAEFKNRLWNNLKERIDMSAQPKTIFREGFHTITPYIIVNEAAELIEFVKNAFGAEELFRTTGSAGGIHCEVKIGDSMVMIGGGGQWKGTPSPGTLLLYVDDVDAAYERAIKAGAIAFHEPSEKPYGDRDAGVTDSFGNSWWISTRRPAEHNLPDMHSILPMQSFKGTPAAIEFFEKAFGVKVAYRAESPDGTVVHAKLKFGDSYYGLSEAHGPFQPAPRTYFLYIENVDEMYRQAIASGATSESEPSDQPYGDRVAGVKDPFGNTWYLATPIATS